MYMELPVVGATDADRRAACCLPISARRVAKVRASLVAIDEAQYVHATKSHLQASFACPPAFSISSASIGDLPPKTGVLTPPRPHRVVCRMVFAIGQGWPVWGSDTERVADRASEDRQWTLTCA